MLRLSALLLLAMLAISVSASADEWEKDYSPSGKPVIRVDANDADIRVNDWDRKDIEARILTRGTKTGPKPVPEPEGRAGIQSRFECNRPGPYGLFRIPP